MGTTFRYIADAALVPSGLGACQHCERADVVSYRYRGKIVEPAHAANARFAKEEPEIHAACVDCIHGGNVRKDEYEVSRIQSIVNSFAVDKLAAIRNYHQIPHIPLMMQDEDWPMCCGDWCEFQGNPRDYCESVQVPTRHTFWHRRPSKWEFGFDLKPESLREVCIFHCLHCDRSYFIWQPT